MTRLPLHLRVAPTASLNAFRLAVAKAQGAANSPQEVFERRLERQRRRIIRRANRIYGWSHCGLRQSRRYTRQVEQGRLKVENGLVPDPMESAMRTIQGVI